MPTPAKTHFRGSLLLRERLNGAPCLGPQAQAHAISSRWPPLHCAWSKDSHTHCTRCRQYDPRRRRPGCHQDAERGCWKWWEGYQIRHRRVVGSLSPSRQAAASPSHASRHSSLRTNPRVSFWAPRTTRAPQGLRTDEAGHFILYSNLTGCAECASIRLLCRVKT